MRFSAEDFENIKRDIDLVQAIEGYGVKFSKGKCKCIFHNDTRPSMSVKDGRFTCWACGAHGDIFDWVQKYFNMTIIQAAEKLCNDFNLPYGRERLTKHERRILAERERSASAQKKIALNEEKRKLAKYMELLDEYRELGFRIDKVKDEILSGAKNDNTESLGAMIARRQYLDYILAHDSEEVLENIGEIMRGYADDI